MDLKTLRAYCLRKKGTPEERPFDFETLVYNVVGKMFALTSDEPQPASVNLKCNPGHVLALRA